MRNHLNLRTNIALGLIFAFLVNAFGPGPTAQAQEFSLPAPGIMVHLSPPLDPPILKGIKVHPDNPFRFDFIMDKGNEPQQEQLKIEATKLIKYFLASLTIPENDLWVNLSPYEKDRIIPQSFGLTEMGRDLLAEDYMLKQITASLIYPEDAIGKKFWKRIYEEAAKKFGTTDIPVNTFNKVWIVPDKALVYENAKAGTAYVVEAKLKVMLDQDYLSMNKHANHGQISKINALGSQIIREIVIPELTKEVNEGKNFAQLRQVYNSLILAAWYKKKIKDSILEQVYADKRKVEGVGYKNSLNINVIYQRYLQAFKKGVYNYIKEEQDPLTRQAVPRKYFSGGTSFTNEAMTSAVAYETNTGLISNLKFDDEEVIGIQINQVKDHLGIDQWGNEFQGMIGNESQKLGLGDEQIMADITPVIVGEAQRFSKFRSTVPLIAVGVGPGHVEENLRLLLPDAKRFPMTVIDPVLERDEIKRDLVAKIPDLAVIPKKIEKIDAEGLQSPLIYGVFFLEYTDRVLALAKLKELSSPDAQITLVLHYYFSPEAAYFRDFIHAQKSYLFLMASIQNLLEGRLQFQVFNDQVQVYLKDIQRSEKMLQSTLKLLGALHSVYLSADKDGMARLNNGIKALVDEGNVRYVDYLRQLAPFVDDVDIYIPSGVMSLGDEKLLRGRFNQVFQNRGEVRAFFVNKGFKLEKIGLQKVQGNDTYFVVQMKNNPSDNKAMKVRVALPDFDFPRDLAKARVKVTGFVNKVLGRKNDSYVQQRIGSILAASDHRILVPEKVYYHEEANFREMIHQDQSEAYNLMKQLQTKLTGDMNNKDKVLKALFDNGNETIVDLIRLGSFLRGKHNENVDYHKDRYDPRPPLQYAIETNNFLKIGKDLYITPITESFRRHIIFKTNEQGNVLFAIEMLIPGEINYKKSLNADMRKMVANDINNSFPTHEYTPDVLLTKRIPFRGVMLYGERWNGSTAEVSFSDYPLDGKRLQFINGNTRSDWARQMGISEEDLDVRIMSQSMELMAAAQALGYTSAGDLAAHNFRVGMIYDREDHLKDIEVQLAGDYSTFVSPHERLLIHLTAAAIGIGTSHFYAAYLPVLAFESMNWFGSMLEIYGRGGTVTLDQTFKLYFKKIKEIALNRATDKAQMARGRPLGENVRKFREMAAQGLINYDQGTQLELANKYHVTQKEVRSALASSKPKKGRPKGTVTNNSNLTYALLDRRFYNNTDSTGAISFEALRNIKLQKIVKWALDQHQGIRLEDIQKRISEQSIPRPALDEVVNVLLDNKFKIYDKNNKEITSAEWNKAMVIQRNTGGIDLTPANFDLQTQSAGGGISFHIDPAMLQELRDSPGFVPLVISVQPLKSLIEFLDT